MHLRLAVALFFALIAGCARTAVPAPSDVAAADIADMQAAAATIVVPAIVDVRAAVDAVVPEPPPNPCTVHPDAVALIVRYEITSETYYTTHLQSPVWPGEQSGVTWGVGYDGGHQTRARILEDWSEHTSAGRLSMTAGVIGPRAKALVPSLADIRIPYPLAASVFEAATLPSYCELAARTFRSGWRALPPLAQGVLVVTVYNRGAGMQGDRRREMRTLRDVCVPAADLACMAREFRAMPRLWMGTPIEAGMTGRYEATAALVERAAKT